MQAGRVVAVAPCPLLPLEEGCGSRGLLVGVGVLGVGGSAGLHIPVCPGRSFMLFAGMKALAGAAVVDHAHSTRRQTKGSGPGLVPLRTHPRRWGKGGVLPPRPPPIPSQLSVGHVLWAALGCPGLPSAGFGVAVALALWLVLMPLLLGCGRGCLFQVASALWLVMLPPLLWH